MQKNKPINSSLNKLQFGLAIALIAGQYISTKDVCINAYANSTPNNNSAVPTTKFASKTKTAARTSIVNTAIDLHHAYHIAPASNQAALRNQQWWSHEYNRRQQIQRLLTWKDRKEAIAFARHMADPRSPESLGYRQIALRAQALQAKLPAEERTKIALHPIMTSAKPLSQIYATQTSSINIKRLPAKK